jgi:hypothetical protein
VAEHCHVAALTRGSSLALSHMLLFQTRPTGLRADIRALRERRYGGLRTLQSTSGCSSQLGFPHLRTVLLALPSSPSDDLPPRASMAPVRAVSTARRTAPSQFEIGLPLASADGVPPEAKSLSLLPTGDSCRPSDKPFVLFPKFFF